MDLSKLPDAQRLQLEQLQQQFQQHQAQQQKQQEELAAAAAVQQPQPTYDSSQVHQSYDPSQDYNQSYYYNYSYQDASQQQQPQQLYDASYYQTYYSNAYPQQQYMQPETSAAPAYTMPSEPQRNAGSGSGSGSLGLGQVHDQGGTQPNTGYPVPPGLNPAAAAAVAALSQLTQFAGTMGAAERAMGGGEYGPPMTAGGHYGHGHVRPPVGHSPYRGGGRGNFGFRPPNTGRLGLPKGRGRGGRHDPSDGAEPARIAWCELCRVDCTSKEILEQHNNGKRHKKNLQRLQHMKTAYQPVSDTEKDEKPVSDTPTNDDQEKKPWMKRKMRGGGGRGGKRQRQGATGPSRPKVVIPLMCDLCNVKCDTQEVFDRHVAGKKHVAKLKKFEGHQAMYGPTAVQALYPPNPLSQTVAYYGVPSSYSAPPEAYEPTHQAVNPNPHLADVPLQFGTQNAVQASTGETVASS